MYKNKSYICTGGTKMKTHFKYIYIYVYVYIYIISTNIKYLGISQTKILQSVWEKFKTLMKYTGDLIKGERIHDLGEEMSIL